MTEPTLLAWCIAAAPLVLLLTLTWWRVWSTSTSAFLVVGLAVLAALLGADAGPRLLLVALGKGLWLGLWIGYVVAPALLLYRVAAPAGLERVGRRLAALSDNPLQGLLLVAWLLPSLIQGIAGFGAPIVLVAPLLVAMGYPLVKAVAYPLIGYCWSVTFGSMASSFYMAAVTSSLDATETVDLALRSSVLLAVLALGCAVTLCLLEGGLAGLRRSAGFIAVTWVCLAPALVGTALVVPAMASVTAAGSGLAAAAGWAALTRRGRPPAPRDRSLPILAVPYAALLGVAMPVFLIPTSRDWVREHLVLAPSFPSTTDGTGAVNPAVDAYTPLAVLGHPGTYVLFACVVGWWAFRRSGLWGADVSGWTVVRGWWRSLPATLVPIALLTVLSAVLVESGMTTTLATGLAATLGAAYPVAAPLLGAAGSFMSGSTTSSNALFSGLQAETAHVLGIPVTAVVAAQTVGANIGNSVAPVIVATGLGSVGAPQESSRVIRRVLPPATGLMGLLTALVAAMLWLGLWPS